MSQATFRHARATEIPEVLALWQVAAENDSRPSDSAETVEALIERDAEALELAIVDGRIVGSLIAGWDGWRAHLYRLAVHPDARRQGNWQTASCPRRTQTEGSRRHSHRRHGARAQRTRAEHLVRRTLRDAARMATVGAPGRAVLATPRRHPRE